MHDVLGHHGGMSTDAAPGDGTVLETERLRLRRWIVADAALQHRLRSERDRRVPAYRRLSEDGRPTVEDLEERIRLDEPPQSLGLLAVVRKDSGEVVGYCGLLPRSYGRDDEPELAYEFLREQWGRGLATEASREVIAWATSAHYPRLWATVREWNAASRAVMRKLGFAETARVDRDVEHGDSLFYMKDLVLKP